MSYTSRITDLTLIFVPIEMRYIFKHVPILKDLKTNVFTIIMKNTLFFNFYSPCNPDVFLHSGILIYTSKAFNWKSDMYNLVFPVFLYPFSEMALCSSIYMTVVIAVERFFGLCRPLQRLSGRGPFAAKVRIKLN